MNHPPSNSNFNISNINITKDIKIDTKITWNIRKLIFPKATVININPILLVKLPRSRSSPTVLKVLNEGCYFDPKFYGFNSQQRIVYTLDFSIIIHANINVLRHDAETIYFILSILQLRKLNLLSDSIADYYLDEVCLLLGLQWRYKHKTFLYRMSHLIGNTEVERLEIFLSDAQVDTNVVAAVKAKFKRESGKKSD